MMMSPPLWRGSVASCVPCPGRRDSSLLLLLVSTSSLSAYH